MNLHRAKVAIVMEERVVVDDAESADDEFNDLADRDALAPQKPVVPCRDDGQLGVQHADPLEFAQRRLQFSRLCPGACTLHDFVSANALARFSAPSRGWQTRIEETLQRAGPPTAARSARAAG